MASSDITILSAVTDVTSKKQYPVRKGEPFSRLARSRGRADDLGHRLRCSVGANIVIKSVAPGGPAARAGLRQGDLIDIDAITVVERFSLLGFGGEALLNRRPLILSVHKDSLQKELTVIPRPLRAERYWDFLLGAFGSLWLLVFAALIAWRRADMLHAARSCYKGFVMASPSR
jgi:hypothetical protein